MSKEITKPVNSDEQTTIDDLQVKKDYLLSQKNFERLIIVQRTVEQATEMRPTFKKLINGLMTDEALMALTDRLIKQLG